MSAQLKNEPKLEEKAPDDTYSHDIGQESQAKKKEEKAPPFLNHEKQSSMGAQPNPTTVIDLRKELPGNTNSHSVGQKNQGNKIGGQGFSYDDDDDDGAK